MTKFFISDLTAASIIYIPHAVWKQYISTFIFTSSPISVNCDWVTK